MRPRKIILSEISNSSVDVNNFTIKNIDAIRKSLNRARQKVLLPLLTSVAEVHMALNQMNLVTLNGEEFLLINDDLSNIIIFTCHEILKFLYIIYVDGTFSYCPKFFKQFFIIRGFINDFNIPLVFCVLKDKFTNTYKQAFSCIKDKVMENFNLAFNLKYITADFKISIHNAAKMVWPSSEIIGFRFHLSQA